MEPRGVHALSSAKNRRAGTNDREESEDVHSAGAFCAARPGSLTRLTERE